MTSLWLSLLLSTVLFCSVLSDYALVGMIYDGDPNSIYNSNDLGIQRGLILWARWVNDHGGIKLFDSSEPLFVNLTYVDISKQPNPTNLTAQIQSAAAELIDLNPNLDVFLAPFAGFRAEAACDVWISKTNKSFPFLSSVGGTVAMTLNGRPNVWYSSSAVGEIVRPPITMLLDRIGGDCVVNLISRKNDSFWSIVYDEVVDLLDSGDLYPYVWLNQTNPVNPNYPRWAHVDKDLDLPGQDGDLTLTAFANLMPQLVEPFDVLIIMGVEGFEAGVYNTIINSEKLQNKAVVIPKPIDFIDQGFLSGNVPKYWIFSADFHQDMTWGQPGKYMGTTRDFYNYYQTIFGVTMNSTYAAYSAADLVAWQLCVERSGTQWRNATRIVEERNKLSVYDETAETFWGRTQYDPYGENIGKVTAAVQYVGTSLKMLNAPGDIVYPAPWPYLSGDGDGLDTADIVGIVVGTTAAFLIILAMLVIIGVIVFLIIYRTKFHMIILPKGRQQV